MSNYSLNWQSYSQWMPEDTEIGGIYTDEITFHALGDYTFRVTFRVGECATLGILFCEVEVTEPDSYVTKRHYAFGQFHTNRGAKIFAQFALNRFIETETWDVCPSFEPIDYINGEPYTLKGEEIVSSII